MIETGRARGTDGRTPPWRSRGAWRHQTVVGLSLLVLVLAVGVAHPNTSGASPGAQALLGIGSSESSGSSMLAAFPVIAGMEDMTALPFSISGRVGGLFPGKVVSLTLKASNPNGAPIKVTSIKTRVGSPSSHCLAASVRVTPFSGSRFVGAHGSTKIVVKVSMGHGAPNACEGRTFPFHYSGLARGV
jgi:hypothetical protein